MGDLYGPIDMFSIPRRRRRGKAAVLEVCRQIADNVPHPPAFDPGIHHARRGFGGIDDPLFSPPSPPRSTATSRSACGSAHFAHFKAGRLLSIRVLIDTFDLVEQALGHPIHPAEDRVVKPALPRTQRSA